ncbi:hypothetical protein GG344DRAFT_71292 [Lentinula edodes]|nr:hypothetical protein GG344DRAFT_71292 [Lentinula edodes]
MANQRLVMMVQQELQETDQWFLLLKAEVEVEVKAEVEAEVKAEVEAEVEMKVEVEVEVELKVEVKAEVELDFEVEVEVEVEVKAEVELKVELKVEVKAKVEVEVKAEVKVELKVEVEAKMDLMARVCSYKITWVHPPVPLKSGHWLTAPVGTISVFSLLLRGRYLQEFIALLGSVALIACYSGHFFCSLIRGHGALLPF